MKKSYCQKKFLLIVILGIIFLNISNNLLFAKALENVTYVVSEDLNFRSSPTTKKNADGTENIIMELEAGTYVTVLTTEKISGKGCSSGFYHISYDGKEGYVCSSYLNNPENDLYNRPWNTPKKAIMGGAKWISSGYISKGQYTSYLKKYNVNPYANSSMFNHQYQTNIAAPSSESTSTYKAYLENNLLDLPFTFSIPIYLNMADKYDRPGGNLTTLDFLDEVEDQDFEQKLDAVGFPESYKRYLRYLHKIHPSWNFTTIETNVDYTYAVNIEQSVGAIDIASQYDESMTLVEGSRWYLPSFASTAYYMDPRNFLTEKYIFQFESLEYNENYTEDIVKSVLKNTFMADISLIDNESYSSMFVLAGKTYNVSPVYLASLSRQEVGTNGSASTSGNEFTYQGVTYSGLFNFYNIGANSGVYDGLVYASGRFCTICATFNPSPTDPSNKEEIQPPVAPVVESARETISKMGVSLTNNYVIGFNVGQGISTIGNSNVTFSSDGIIKTGTTLKFADGSTYEAVLYGDLSGDGLINSADLLKMRMHLLGTSILESAYKEAAELTKDGQINSADLLKLRQYLLGTTNINQL